jgi:hypothetical protein
MADLNRLVEWIKLSPRYLIPLSLFSNFLLFAPSDVLAAFDSLGLAGRKGG